MQVSFKESKKKNHQCTGQEKIVNINFSRLLLKFGSEFKGFFSVLISGILSFSK